MAADITAIPDSVKPNVWVKDNHVLPNFIRDEYLKDIYNLKLQDIDVVIVTWPKSGTTWTQYIVSQIIHGQEHMRRSNSFLFEHIFLEMPQNLKDFSSDGRYKLAEDVSSPRFLKSHLLLRYLPHEIFEKQANVIYIARNPKDTAVSYYNHCLADKLMPTYRWDEFIDQFCRGLLPFGDWFEHVLQWWKKRDEPNVLFIKYEDMKKDLKKVVAKLGIFLNKSLTVYDVNDICETSSFDNMKENPKANLDKVYDMDWKTEGKHFKFMRKGVIGDWKNWFTVAQSENFDAVYSRKMEGSGLEFSFQ